MAFPFFPESHPAMSVENYAYMRRLWEHRRALHEHEQETREHTEETTPSQSAGRPSSEQASLPLQRSGSGSASQGDERPLRLARTFVPARLRETKSLEYQSSPNDDRHSDYAPRILLPFFSPPTTTATRRGISEAITTSTTTPTGDPAKYIFQSYSALLTNPLSLGFELNPLLLNITHPLLSKHHTRRGKLRILDLDGIEGSLYTQAIATLPKAAVCQLTQPQLSTKYPPHLPFKSKSFDVVTTRTLYKFLSSPHQAPTTVPKSWIREIHRVLDRGGNFEFLFFDCHLSNAGSFTREMEPYLYQYRQFCICSRIHEICTCSPQAPTPEAMTGAQFLELLTSEGFRTEKSTTLMFPFALLSLIFTQDGQRLRANQGGSGSDQSNVTPLLASLMKTIDEECRTSQTAWRCTIGSVQKR